MRGNFMLHVLSALDDQELGESATEMYEAKQEAAAKLMALYKGEQSVDSLEQQNEKLALLHGLHTFFASTHLFITQFTENPSSSKLTEEQKIVVNVNKQRALTELMALYKETQSTESLKKQGKLLDELRDIHNVSSKHYSKEEKTAAEENDSEDLDERQYLSVNVLL